MTCKHLEVIKRTFTTFSFYQCAHCKAEVTETGEPIAAFKSEKAKSALPKGYRHLLRKEGFKEPRSGYKAEELKSYVDLEELEELLDQWYNSGMFGANEADEDFGVADLDFVD